MILVDTDIMIDIFRDYSYAITWLDTLGNEEIILPGFMVMELIQGCGNKTELEKVKKNWRLMLSSGPHRRYVIKHCQYFSVIASVMVLELLMYSLVKCQ